MRRCAAILFVIGILTFVSCTKEQKPSYVGTWQYESSEPDLGPAYLMSVVTVAANGDYTFFDGGTGSSFSGEFGDFVHDGLTITLNAHNDSERRTYVATVKMLKGGKMVVETESVNGVVTLIVFRRLE